MLAPNSITAVMCFCAYMPKSM